ncbi:MAG: hypothetical protein ABSA46_09175 [Thermodesulfovibrionales bacterium]
MKKMMLFVALIFVLTLVPIPTMAGVSVNVGVGLPPPIVAPPPDVIAMPNAPGVYVAPDIGVDLFFWNGWWWQLWNGHWYRSRYYDRGWGYYSRGVPGFYRHVNPGWRGYYGSRMWNGRPWNYKRIPHQQFQHRH